MAIQQSLNRNLARAVPDQRTARDSRHQRADRAGPLPAWTHREWNRATKSLGLLAATAGALLGGWLGFTVVSGLFAIVTTTIGAAAAGNLALIAVSLFREPSAGAAMATLPPNNATPTDSDDVATALATPV